MAGVARFRDPTLISVVMPVFNPNPAHLKEAIHSVQDQFYPWWELCIADDASTDPAIQKILQDAAAQDRRIKVVRRETNGHISAASNSALAQAEGQFIALLDHDDVLAPHALYEVAECLLTHPDADVIFSDEDHIDASGRRSHPYFKPGWNPELMLGQNLISHLGVFRRSLMEQVGGFRVGFEGSQDHDLALRVVSETTADRIIHIPKILYHWRQQAYRTFSQSEPDRCVLAARRAVTEFVTRTVPGARVEAAPQAEIWNRVVYPLPAIEPLVSVIISCGGRSVDPGTCIEGLRNRTNYDAIEILLAGAPGNHAASDGARIRGDGWHSADEAARAAEGNILLFLDAALTDAHPDWMRELVSRAIQPEIGAVGARIRNPGGTIAHAGLVVGGPQGAFAPLTGCGGDRAGYFGHLALARDVTAVSGGCLMVRREPYLQVNGRDETLPAILGDVDLCLKLRDLGLRNVWTPYADIGRASFGNAPVWADSEAWRQGVARMRQRWGGRLAWDPFWNPNLVYHDHEISLPQAATEAGARLVARCASGQRVEEAAR